MKTFGLTGGIGMGKSAAAEHLRRRNVPVIDTDELARQVVEPDQPAWHEIRNEFGARVLDAQGRLRRDVLAAVIFSDSTARRKLEAIMHPRIRTLWKSRLDAWRAERKPVAVVVIPLLFETGAQSELDATICIACSAETQRRRLLDRGWSPGQIAQRIAAQWPIEKKMACSDFVVWNEAGLEVLAGQLDRIIARG